MNSTKLQASPEEALERAVALAGNRTQLARSLGITKAAVHHWRQVPALRVIEVEKLTGVRRELLRPDLYPAG